MTACIRRHRLVQQGMKEGARREYGTCSAVIDNRAKASIAAPPQIHPFQPFCPVHSIHPTSTCLPIQSLCIEMWQRSTVYTAACGMDAAHCREQVPQGADLDVEDCPPVIIRPAQQPLQPPPVDCGRQLLGDVHALLQKYLPLASIFLREWPAYVRDPRISGAMLSFRIPMVQEPHDALLHVSPQPQLGLLQRLCLQAFPAGSPPVRSAP